MVLSNYKCMHIRIQGSQAYSSNVSSNRIKIQEILLILQIETDYFSKLFISEMHSKQWHYSLHRDFQNCYSTRRSPTGFFKLQFQLQCYTCTLHYNPENSPSRIQFYMQKTKSSSSTTLHSTHRRQGDLLEKHPCVLHDIPDTPVAPETFQTFQSFMTFQPSRQFYTVPVSPGNPPHSSILRSECIFYSSIGFHRKLHRVPVGQLQTFIHSSKKGRCCDIGQIDRFSIIELFPLSSCQVIILIARMTFNCSTSCLMS